MKTSPFKYQIISTQTWNDNKTQLISEHKTLKQAEKMKLVYEKENLQYLKRTRETEGNIYNIQTL